MKEFFLDVSQEAGAALFSRNIKGEIVMLNLLSFREIADYATCPELAPNENISGEEAYQKYIEMTLPILRKTGGDLIFLGQGGKYLIGPQDEEWDMVMLVRQNSLDDFMAFSSNEQYLKILGHRTAALKDSRLLPLVESKI